MRGETYSGGVSPRLESDDLSSHSDVSACSPTLGPTPPSLSSPLSSHRLTTASHLAAAAGQLSSSAAQPGQSPVARPAAGDLPPPVTSSRRPGETTEDWRREGRGN